MKWWWDSLCYPPVTIRSSERCWQEALGESPCPCDQPRALDIPVVSCTCGLVSWQETTITNRSQKYNMDEHVCFALCLPSRRWQLSVALLFYHTLSTAKQVSDYWNKQPVAKEIHVYIYIYNHLGVFAQISNNSNPTQSDVPLREAMKCLKIWSNMTQSISESRKKQTQYVLQL